MPHLLPWSAYTHFRICAVQHVSMCTSAHLRLADVTCVSRCQVLAAAGVASRRASEELVFAGEVSVNGATVLQPQTPVDPQRDEV